VHVDRRLKLPHGRSYSSGAAVHGLGIAGRDGHHTVRNGDRHVWFHRCRRRVDERTEAIALDGLALGAGSRPLKFTYQALPGAPAWSIQRTVTVTPPAFSVSRSPSASAKAKK